MHALNSFLSYISGRTPLATCAAGQDSKDGSHDASQTEPQQGNSTPKPGFLDRRRQKKAEYEAKMDVEQRKIIARHLPTLKELLKES